jgi:hypothetical protein
MPIPAIVLDLQGTAVSAHQTVKILGVTFDQNLTFECHLDAIAAKTTGFLRMLSSRRAKLPRAVLIQLCNAYVSSRILYCLSVLGCVPMIAKRLQVLQNYAVRTVFGVPKFTHVSALRKCLGWRNIQQQALFRFALVMFKAIRNMGPEYLHVHLPDFAPRHRFAIRTSALREPLVENEHGKRTFVYRCVQLYNKVPNRAIWAGNLPNFKSAIWQLAMEWFP